VNGKIVKKSVKTLADLQPKDIIYFFKQLKAEYPAKSPYIDQIYIFLHYHLQEKKLLVGNSNLSIAEMQFPRHKQPWGDIWEDKKQIIQANSPYGRFPSYKCRSVIVKGGDDLRQELICMQVIYKMKEIFANSNLSLWLRPYEIIVTSSSSGMIGKHVGTD